MRITLASGAAVLGATTVSARALRGSPFVGRDTSAANKVDLSAFAKFSFATIGLEEAKAAAAEPATTTAAAPPTVTSSAPSQQDDFFALSGTCTSPAVRVEWRRMTDDQRAAFLAAVVCLQGRPTGGEQFTGSKNRYEDLVSVHQKLVNQVHMTPQFLPWHRYFLAVYEDLLRGECQYSGPMPWWDETIDAGNFAGSPVFGDKAFGSAPGSSGGTGQCVTTGPFANLVLHVGPADRIQDHCLSRALDESLTSQSNVEFVRTCNSNQNYDDMRRCTESGPHAYGHNGIGAVMSDVAASPGDPLFFMHHAFIDRNWRAWQMADPAARTFQVGGQSTPGVALTTEYPLSVMGIRNDGKVNDVMDTTGGYLCYIYDSEQQI